MNKERVRKYRPSNATEGCWFMGEYCANCRRETKVNRCSILGDTMLYSVEDPDYPSEWAINDKGEPSCSKFSDRRIIVKKPKDKSSEIQEDLFRGDI